MSCQTCSGIDSESFGEIKPISLNYNLLRSSDNSPLPPH
jgi:hypothetical protein